MKVQVSQEMETKINADAWLVGWLVKLLVGWNQSAFQTLLGFVRQGGVGGGGLKQGIS